GEGISLTEVVPIGNDDLRADANVGNAIGRYQLSGFFPDGYVDATGKVRLARAKSAYAAYRHFWSPTLRSSLILSASGTDTSADGQLISTNDMEIYMKLLIPSIAALTLSAASLSAGAALKPTDLLGEPAVAPSAERAIYTAVAERTITITGDTKWVNVNHYEVV